MQYYDLHTEKMIRELSLLPKGTVVYKQIGDKKRPYLQWKESGKTKNKYLKKDDLETVQEQIRRRKEIEAELKHINVKLRESPFDIYAKSIYKTNVITGELLESFVSDAAEYDKRDCFSIVEEYLNSPDKDRICALFGLRRSGKTVMLKQAIASIPYYKSRAAYIKLRKTDSMEMLNEDLKKLQSFGISCLFLDEVTLLGDFIDGASLFSDVFAATGMKIIISGTDSLGFWLASTNELYDRVVMVHTTHIPYKEHRRLLKIKDIDEYIRYGGTLRAGELCFDNSVNLQDASFRDEESTRRYIDTAIAHNIQNSLAYFSGGYFRNLRSLYDAGELTNAINRIVERDNHEFAVQVITKIFKSSDLGSASQLAMKAPDESRRSDVLSRIDKNAVTDRLMGILDIRNELLVNVEEHQADAIRDYLKALDLIDEVTVSYLGKAPESVSRIVTLPGLRFCQAQALVFSLEKDRAFSLSSKKESTLIKEIITEDVCGKILEEIVLYETKLFYKKTDSACEVGQLQFADGEIDMYIYDSRKESCELYEIKHSAEVNSKQQRHLNDKNKLKMIEDYFGNISKRSVIYRGESLKCDNGISYINAEEYLLSL